MFGYTYQYVPQCVKIDPHVLYAYARARELQLDHPLSERPSARTRGQQTRGVIRRTLWYIRELLPSYWCIKRLPISCNRALLDLENLLRGERVDWGFAFSNKSIRRPLKKDITTPKCTSVSDPRIQTDWC